MYIEAVILTKSYKNSGYCVAGINLKTGQWVRFVSDDTFNHGAISEADMRYDISSSCEPFDIVRVSVVRHQPISLQPENFLIQKGVAWVKLGSMSIDQVLHLHPAETSPYIFVNNWSALSQDEVCDIDRSLMLVKVNMLTINHMFQGEPTSGKCSFMYRSNQYNFMSVTDPNYRYTGPTNYIGNAYLVVSLPDAPDKSKGSFYKCVSKIIPI